MICLIHKWKTIYKEVNGSGEVHKCVKCGKYRHHAYFGYGSGWMDGIGDRNLDRVMNIEYKKEVEMMEKLIKEGKTYPEIADILMELEPMELTTMYYMVKDNIEKGAV